MSVRKHSSATVRKHCHPLTAISLVEADPCSMVNRNVEVEVEVEGGDTPLGVGGGGVIGGSTYQRVYVKPY